eukprot:1664240-Prorocentrum_lima.AAC.1
MDHSLDPVHPSRFKTWDQGNPDYRRGLSGSYATPIIISVKARAGRACEYKQTNTTPFFYFHQGARFQP